ncbi:MAG: hypothetical protein SOZ97_02335 [Lachnospiraceae bacterium]|nr:hypothetical protein [Lachnospiraceae bacterium]
MDWLDYLIHHKESAVNEVRSTDSVLVIGSWSSYGVLLFAQSEEGH